MKELQELAKNFGTTPTPIALVWLRGLGGRNGRPIIIPIPGATTEKRIEENMQDLDLTLEQMKEVNDILARIVILRDRYGGPQAALMNGQRDCSAFFSLSICRRSYLYHDARYGCVQPRKSA